MRNTTRPAAPQPLDLDRWRGRTRPDRDDPTAMRDMAGVFLVIGCIWLLSWAAYWGLT